MRLSKLFVAVSTALLALSGSVQAATNSSATLTADNEFWLYTGNATGSNLQLVGHGANWQTGYGFNFDVQPGDYLYVMALDWGQPHAWQGIFSTPTGLIVTNSTNWVGVATRDTTVSAAVISSANWGPINTVLPSWSAPWNGRVGDLGANWIWTSGINSGDTTVLFRTANVVAVPEPETYAMFMAGLGIMGAVARRRKQA
jgi:hypothetical protein